MIASSIAFAVVALFFICFVRRGRQADEEADDRAAPSRSKEAVVSRGLEVFFGCGHPDRRAAYLTHPDGRTEIRDVPRPDAHRKNCHACYLETGQDEIRFPN